MPIIRNFCPLVIFRFCKSLSPLFPGLECRTGFCRGGIRCFYFELLGAFWCRRYRQYFPPQIKCILCAVNKIYDWNIDPEVQLSIICVQMQGWAMGMHSFQKNATFLLSFQKNATFLRSFQKNTTFSRFFAFFIKERCILCILLHSL